MTQETEALANYAYERDNLSRYALWLLCPLHGLCTVTEALPLSHILGEVGGMARLDYRYSLTCGCQRRKDIRQKLETSQAKTKGTL